MDDQNTQSFTPTTDQNDSLTSAPNMPPLSPVTPDTPDDFPMISPAQGPAIDSPNSSVIPTPHPTYLSSDSTSDSPAVDLTSTPAPVVTPPQDEDLISIKKSALQQLSPLVGHLEQNPEEKFKTMLMMIQASDDKSMLGAAYEAAQQITDEKLKAQALLDIVNEINYFTHPTENE